MSEEYVEGFWKKYNKIATENKISDMMREKDNKIKELEEKLDKVKELVSGWIYTKRESIMDILEGKKNEWRI